MKLPLNQQHNQHSVYCGSLNGPIFGGYNGRDLCIGNNCNSRDFSYSKLGHSYTLPPGQNEETFLAGSCYFLVADIEVFAAVQQ